MQHERRLRFKRADYLKDGLFSKRESHETNFCLALCIINSKSLILWYKNLSLRLRISLVDRSIETTTRASSDSKTRGLIEGAVVLKSAW